MILDRYELILRHKIISKEDDQEVTITRDDPLVAVVITDPGARQNFGELYILEFMKGKLKEAILRKLNKEGEKE